MLKKLSLLLVVLAVVTFSGCDTGKRDAKIGVSFGVGPAARWPQEKAVMEARAKELGAKIDARLNMGDTPKTQKDDCFELIDSGVDVLVLIPRDVSKMDEILDYAAQKKVPVISYSRVITGRKIDLFVGYDSERIGQRLGKHLSEAAYKGDYILLRGDPNDNNAAQLYAGAMRYIKPMGKSINIILDAAVPGWSPEEAKKMVKAAVAANGNKVDAVLAPNDRIAGACAEALAELKVKKYPVITGMDAELSAVQRLLEGKQAVTMYMDFKVLAKTATEQAYRMARGEQPEINAEFDNQSNAPINAHLITGQLVTNKNIDRVLIDSGYYSREQVHGQDPGATQDMNKGTDKP